MALVNVALVLAAIYVAIVSAMYLGQTWLLFPTGLAATGRPQLPAAAERLEVTAPDGERLAGVRIPAFGDASGRPVVLGFGGNAWNAEAMALYLNGLYPDHDVVAFHYRGYRPSGGRPSAAALLSDSLAVFDRLGDGPASAPVVAVGFSIGAAVAAYLARHRPVAGLILVTPFDSLEALAREHYWWAPVGLLLRHRMPTIDFLRDSPVPTAVIAAARDTIVPARRSEPLAAAIPNLVLERTIDSGHNELYGHPDFADAMRAALVRIAADRPPSGL